jgi:glycosyltransferase involved in cell wall biosynthesis
MTSSVRPNRIVSIQTTTERGGAEYANVDLLAALVARGHDVVLLTNLTDLAANTDVPVHTIELGPKLSSGSLARILPKTPLILWRLVRALRAEQPIGVLLLHFKKEQLLCALLPKRLTGEIVWAEWGPVPMQLRRGVARLLYALAARRTQRIIAISEGTKRSIVQVGVPAEKIEVVPNLVDVESVGFGHLSRTELRRAWGVGEDTLVLGCISRFHPRKRNDVVIDAMAHLEDEDVLLVLAGEGEQEDELRERARPYGERVRFVPNVRGQVESFLSACDLLVFAPSPTEGEPRVIVMAQLVGVPVVATDSEGAHGLIPPGGGVIVSPPHDARALAEVVAAYHEDPVRRRAEGETARLATLESHDTERTLRSVERALGLREG